MQRMALAILIGLLANGFAAADPPTDNDRLVDDRRVSVLHLRSQARVAALPVTLAVVLDFTDADPVLIEAIGAQPLEDADTFAGLEVTHERIVSELDALGVNLARVLVDGAVRCRVTVDLPIPPEAVAAETPEQPVDGAPLIRKIASEPVAEDAAQTLADAIRAYAAAEFDEAATDVEVSFERGRQDFLELTSPPFRFAIRGGSGSRLGLREFKVTIYRDERRQRTVSVFAHVRLERRVLVAAKPLNIGGLITADSVEPATRIFDEDSDLGLTHAEAIIGQKVRHFVPAGELLGTDDIEAVDLVQRSRPVTVVSHGAVGLRVTGTALDAGQYGETIRVRLGSSRRDQRVIRGVVIGVGQARMTEDE